MAATDLVGSIIDRWATKTTLEALWPAATVFNGPNWRGAPPFGTVSRSSTTTLVQSSKRRVDEVTIEIQLRCTGIGTGTQSYENARAVANKLREAPANDGFHKDAWTIAGSYKVLSMRATGDVDERRAKGVWSVTVTFAVQVETPTG